MRVLVIFIKELVESLIRSFKLLFSRAENNNINAILKETGFVKIDGFYTKEECMKLRDKIDHYIESENTNLWVDDSGADHRVYFINEIDDEFNKFYEHPQIREGLLNYTGCSEPSGMLLAARIDEKKGNLGSGGGWHRDSPIRHQFKAVCYLSDVDTNHGPFQYIKGSHCKLDVFIAYLLGVFKTGQYRFTEKEIEKYLKKRSKEITEFTAKEGAVAFSDTKGIHRGKPISEGCRYVLFCYFWSGSIPLHFEKLRQNKK